MNVVAELCFKVLWDFVYVLLTGSLLWEPFDMKFSKILQPYFVFNLKFLLPIVLRQPFQYAGILY